MTTNAARASNDATFGTKWPAQAPGPRSRVGPGSQGKEPTVVLRRRAKRRQVVLEPQPDGLPKHGVFAEPIRVAGLEVLPLEPQEDGTTRVTFLVEVKDADDSRCSDLAVDARVIGPERTATVQATTDLFGRVRVRMTGPAGDYRLEILEVAAKGLRWDAAKGPVEVRVEVP